MPKNIDDIMSDLAECLVRLESGETVESDDECAGTYFDEINIDCMDCGGTIVFLFSFSGGDQMVKLFCPQCKRTQAVSRNRARMN